MRVHNSILSISTVILLLLLGILPAAGQNSLQMYVKGFEQDPTDLTASNPNYRKKDGNGDVYAIIKVKSDTPGEDLNAYNFNFGMMSSTKEVHGDELWLYVQKNAKTVTITRPGYATIQRYDLKIAIQPACTYILTLSSQKPTVQSSILQFKVSPPDEQATVKVKREGSSDDYQIWGTVDQNGSIDNILEEGIYLYKIVADKYFDFEGRVEIDCAEPVYVESVTLKPNFGYLEVTGTEDISGAEIYVNDKKVGEIPYKSSEHWACGDYRIAVVAELYKTYSSTFTIRSGETTSVKPLLEPNFAEITIKTADKAEIWLDGKLSGTGLWKGRLKAGLHNVECRQTSHETSKQQIIVQQGKTETFNIDAPKPITGSLYISSTPSGADIVIDGERIGQVTPYLFNNILTGNHVVALSLADYVQVSQNITITQGNTENIKFSLEKQTYNTTVSAQTALLDNNTNGSENGHEYVDLGLSVKWATCNVGATKPEDYGDYFAWGETTIKSSYTCSNFKYCLDSRGEKFSKYVTSRRYGKVDNRTTLELSDDAAHANWGGSWRMPTYTEIDELLNNCTWTWTTLNGVNGYKVTSNKAGYTDKSIFLPAAGFRYGGNLYDAGSVGYYWSSSLDTNGSSYAYVLYFISSYHYRLSSDRYYGRSVRPVCPSGSYVSVTGVKLNTTSVSLEVGDTTTLTATVSPSNATDKSVTWKSSNTTVATVDSYGKVTAKSAGTATITVTTTDGSNIATCTVAVKSQQSSGGKENGHEYVDLGLPSGIKWATCNVGASKPEDYGDYFAWGETTAKSNYSWSNLKYCLDSKGNKFSKYVYNSSYGTVDNKTTLELSDDAAHVNWGGSWRMPTATEIDELLDNCTWTWTTLNGVNGYKVTSKKSGYTDKSIFLPAAGYRYDGSLYDAGSNGSFWSSSLYTSFSNDAYELNFYSDNHYRFSNGRYFGHSVRPVCP